MTTTQQAAHTPEPWHLSTSGPAWRLNKPEALGYLDGLDRIRAKVCVNACAGIQDPEKAIPQLLEALERLHRVASVELGKTRPDVLDQAQAALSLAQPKGGA